MIANLNENSSSYECQLDSIIQRTGRETEKGSRKTYWSRKSWRVGDQKNTKQKKNMRNRQVSDIMEGVYYRK